MITISVRGTRAVENTLAKVGPKAGLALSRATVSALASEIVRDARGEMSFTGAYTKRTMRKATKKKVRRVRAGIVQNDVIVGKNAFYWRFWEYGQGSTVTRRRMFGKSVNNMRAVLGARWEALFMKKLQARLARERRKAGGV